MTDKASELKAVAEAVRKLLEEHRGELVPADFIEVARQLGFRAYQMRPEEEQLKLVAENHLPDIVGTNLKHALAT